MEDQDSKKKTGTPSFDKQESTYTEATRVASEENTLRIKVQANGESIQASLLLLSGPQSLVGFSWSLLQDVTTVGRSTRLADISIPNDSLSKSHFQIANKNGNFYVMDLKSTNKTQKNKDDLEPYKEYLLKDNDRVWAAHIVFKFLDKGNVENISSRDIFNKMQTDPLTGANNRQSLEFKAKEFFVKYKEASIIVFDVDKFKIINDSYGHLAGDYVLKTISQLVKEIIREEDIFFRYGGDEFCIFTPYPIKVASSIAKRITQKIEHHDFTFEDKKIEVSLSIGVSQKQQEDKEWKSIYQRADERCYEEKKS